ncbi:hypothetical protein ACL7TT_11445 [Microbulbifer sp. 2304DJ12-6]|uniref:hypothetical protein n=1 Tax=Microbulbifer sp. 2304DJ12-6 TaxID=3233340 RepID=UPI0039AF819F
MKHLIVPIDIRNGRPLITNTMKSQCIGEHTFFREEACGQCLLEGHRDDCEYCQGSGEYLQEITVPWTTAKEIYKAMTEAAVRGEG